MTDPDTARRWWTDGERAVAGAVQQLSDDDLRQPSALPGWTRAHVVAHLARNADALVNLCTWARTGDPTPMYPSREARDAGIEATAVTPADALRADVRDAAARLADAVAGMPEQAWTATVRNGQGRAVPASEIPWMRAKEVWVHGADLGAGLTFSSAPPAFLKALVDDVLALFAARGEAPYATIRAPDVGRSWGSGPVSVEGPVAAVAAWLTRSDRSGLSGDVPPPPAWL